LEDKTASYKDFNNAAMFQVSDVTFNPMENKPAAAYMMSVKIWETSTIAKKWLFEEAESEAGIATKSQKIMLEYDALY